MDDVFADSGFSNRQSIKKIKVLVTQPDGTTKEVEKEVVDDWCGMFAAANMFRGAALDKDLRKAFAHTDNVNDFFQYTANVNASRAPLSVFADGPVVVGEGVPRVARQRRASGSWARRRRRTSAPATSR